MDWRRSRQRVFFKYVFDPTRLEIASGFLPVRAGNRVCDAKFSKAFSITFPLHPISRTLLSLSPLLSLIDLPLPLFCAKWHGGGGSGSHCQSPFVRTPLVPVRLHCNNSKGPPTSHFPHPECIAIHFPLKYGKPRAVRWKDYCKEKKLLGHYLLFRATLYPTCQKGKGNGDASVEQVKSAVSTKERKETLRNISWEKEERSSP